MSRRANTSRNSEPRLIRFSDLLVGSSAAYLVKGIIPRVGVTVVYGEAKTGKSFWVFDLLMHVALGRPYRGRAVVSGPVVYCAFEGAEGFTRRAEAFRRIYVREPEEPPFFLVPNRLDFIADHRLLIESIRETLGEQNPVAIVLDTLNRGLVGSENSDLDMGRFILAADAVKEAFQCAVVVIHHTGRKGGAPRGHSSLTGAADAQLFVRRSGNVITVKVEHMKDGEQDLALSSCLETIDLGRDDDGDPITSCVIRPTAQRGGESRMPAQAAIAFDALNKLLINAPDQRADDGAPAVSEDRWRTQCYAQQISKKGTDDANRVAFGRAKKWLIDENRIAFDNGMVSVANIEQA